MWKERKRERICLNVSGHQCELWLSLSLLLLSSTGMTHPLWKRVTGSWPLPVNLYHGIPNRFWNFHHFSLRYIKNKQKGESSIFGLFYLLSSFGGDMFSKIVGPNAFYNICENTITLMKGEGNFKFIWVGLLVSYLLVDRLYVRLSKYK